MALYIRLECEVLTDAKILQVGPEAAFVWVRGLLYSKQHLTDGFIPTHALPLVTLGVTRDMRDIVTLLVTAGLWDVVENGWHIGAERWARHQTTREDVTRLRESWRRRKDRERQRKNTVTPMSRRDTRNVPPPEPEPEPEKKEDTPTRKERVGVVRAKEPRANPAIRLPDGAVLTDTDRAYAERLDIPDPAAEWEKFSDHHHAKGTRFADWPAAWRNWCRNAVAFAQRDNGRTRGSLSAGEKTMSAMRRVAQRIINEEDER